MAKPRNKKYRPKGVNPDALSWALAGVHTLPKADQQKAMEQALEGFGRLKQGKAEREDWNAIVQVANLGEALTLLHIGDNLKPAFDDAHQALHEIALRMLHGKSSTCYAHELAAIQEAFDMYRIQLSICTQAEFGRAVAYVKKILLSNKVMNVAKTYAALDRVAA